MTNGRLVVVALLVVLAGCAGPSSLGEAPFEDGSQSGARTPTPTPTEGAAAVPSPTPTRTATATPTVTPTPTATPIPPSEWNETTKFRYFAAVYNATIRTPQVTPRQITVNATNDSMRVVYDVPNPSNLSEFKTDFWVLMTNYVHRIKGFTGEDTNTSLAWVPKRLILESRHDGQHYATSYTTYERAKRHIDAEIPHQAYINAYANNVEYGPAASEGWRVRRPKS